MGQQPEQLDVVRKRKMYQVLLALVAVVLAFFLGSYWGEYRTLSRTLELKEKVTNTPIQLAQKPVEEVSKVEEVCKDWEFTVTVGYYLSRIAKEQYGGRAYLWRLIAETNGIKFPYIIHPGQVLKIKACLCDLAPLSESSVNEVVKARTPVQSSLVQTLVKTEVYTKKVTEVEKVFVDKVIREPSVVSEPPTVPVLLPNNTEKVQIPEVRQSLFRVSVRNLYHVGPNENKNKTDELYASIGYKVSEVGKNDLELFAGLSAVRDNRGRQRYNLAGVQTGVRLIRVSEYGLAEVSGALGFESRQEIARGVMGPTKFGLVLATRGQYQNSLDRLPSRLEWDTGASPWNKGVNSDIRLEAGVTIAKKAEVHFIPDVWSRTRFDSKDSGNRWIANGGGLRVALPFDRGVADFKVGFECVNFNPNSTCGPTGKIEFRYGLGYGVGSFHKREASR